MSLASRRNAPCASLEKALPAPPAYQVVETKANHYPNITVEENEENVLLVEDRGDCGAEKDPARHPLKTLWMVLLAWMPIKRSARIKHWKPVTLGAPILGPFIVFSIALIIILELLAGAAGLSSNINGSAAIAFAKNDDSFPASISFAYLYLPTVIAVCYSMVWSWVDLDAKRLEPWFQLSQEQGASAEDSLLLQYPFEFLAFVPLKAARRKQWVVLYAGTAMMIIFWAITPLQSAIFGTNSVLRIRSTKMITTATLMPLTSQVKALNANFLMTSYGISWLNQKVPGFTTKTHAVIPFAPPQAETTASNSETWWTRAEAYNTDLTCTPAKSTILGLGNYAFDNGKGCIAPGVTLPLVGPGNTVLMYIGYYDDAHIDWALQNPKCGIEFSSTFLAIWASGDSQTAIGQFENMTALFCEPSYTVRDVQVQVNATDHSVVADDFDTTTPNYGTPRPMPSDIFNFTNFHYLIGTGVTEKTQTQLTDFPNTVSVEQYPRYYASNLSWPSTNMVGYGVAASAVSPDKLGDPNMLQAAFTKAHQLLFSIAFNTLLQPLSLETSLDLRGGEVQDLPTAIILVRPFAIAIEVLLGLVSCMAGAIWIMSARRQSQMIRDPASIGDIITMVSECAAMKDIFRDIGSTSVEELKNRLDDKKFRLRGMVEHRPPIMHLEALQNKIEKDDKVLVASQYQSRAVEHFVSSFRPVALRIPTALIFIATISLSIGGLFFLNLYTSKRNGLELPSSSPVVRQILENYLPTVLATALEPFWVVLNRLLCVLKPFDELRQGRAIPARSIDVKYTSLPPPLVFLRAIKARHFLLSIVCAIAILANVLAVSLSGLFNEAAAAGFVVFHSSYAQSSYFDGTPFLAKPLHVVTYSEHYYVSLANASSGTSLPPWIGEDFFFIPFNLNNKTGSSDAKFSATTRGFGISATCETMTSSSSRNRLDFTEFGDHVEISVLHQERNGTEITCVDLIDRVNQGVILQDPPGDAANAFEVITYLSLLGSNPLSSAGDDGICERLLVAGWGRLGPNRTPQSNGTTNSTIQGRSFDTTFIVCEPTLQTALFDVTVDVTGRILDTQQKSSFDTDLQPYFKGKLTTDLANPAEFMTNQTGALYTEANDLITGYIRRPTQYQWHNATLTSDWINYLLAIRMNSSELVNASSPVPDPGIVAPALASLYRQLFAILLGLNTHVFAPLDPSSPSVPVTVTVTTPEQRIFMSQLMFQITLVILVLNLVVAVVYYARRPKRFLPMMPTTIASIAGLVVGTRALKDYSWDKPPQNSSSDISQGQTGREVRGNGSRNRMRNGKNKVGDEARYGYGRFVGTDGITRIGIERHPFVIPLETQNPAAIKRRIWGWRIGKGSDEKEPKTWI